MTAFRHILHRHVTDQAPTRWLGVVMVNPSTAESWVNGANDATIRSLLRIAERNEFDGLMVGNVSPFRATDPEDLFRALDSGTDVFDREENDRALLALASRCEAVVCAWGATPLKHRALELRASEVRALLLGRKPVLHCFGKTKTGWPKHPLYLATATSLMVFATRSEAALVAGGGA